MVAEVKAPAEVKVEARRGLASAAAGWAAPKAGAEMAAARVVAAREVAKEVAVTASPDREGRSRRSLSREYTR